MHPSAKNVVVATRQHVYCYIFAVLSILTLDPAPTYRDHHSTATSGMHWPAGFATHC